MEVGMAARGIETRERLIQTALRLFREVGFQATTMRRIADEAGVSLGNAYYYFASKDELVHELYLVIQREHRDRVEPALRQGAPLEENLRTVLHAGVDVMTPYHGFGGSFVQIALPTSSRTSPFSAESSDARSMAVDLMGRAVDASEQRASRALGPELPSLLWLVYLAVTLHWVTDGSPDQLRTRTLIDGIVPVIAKAITMSRLPMARGLVHDVLALMSALGADDATVAASR
jgi:AcrR family transcriptional regulator